MISHYQWWKGERGEWYVVAQIVLFILLFFGPRTSPGLPEWRSPYAEIGGIVGSFLLVIGGAMFMSGIFMLGRNITPLPYPKDQAELIESGPYRFVRHPIYSGGIIFAFGWALWNHGWFTIGYAVILLVFFDIKARREEKWLKEKFTNYAGYQKRVRKLIPFVY
jgi:protein-S-isoprenylcysteine O-methyltransferase Ste14